MSTLFAQTCLSENLRSLQYVFLLTAGAAKYGGGGAGGRIAIYHTDTNHYAGDYIVSGGKGYNQWGGSGTVYRKDLSVSPTVTQLTTDNGGYQVNIQGDKQQ